MLTFLLQRAQKASSTTTYSFLYKKMICKRKLLGHFLGLEGARDADLFLLQTIEIKFPG